MPQTYYFDKRGQWSGGGKAFLANVADAETRHAILRGGPGAIPIIPRNVPVRGGRKPHRFILAPQNAWAWKPKFEGLEELKLVTGLRIASTYYLHRAEGVFRISSSVPSAKGRPFSPVIHNVLDPTFESALLESQSVTIEGATGKLVSVGSGHSYRNLVNLIEGYRVYRANGGELDLWIAGPPGSLRIRKAVEQAAARTYGVTIKWGSLSRADCLAVLRAAAGVVLPSQVEASPLAALEAAAVNPRIVVSDIIAHREIFGEYGDVSDNAFFDPDSHDQIAKGLYTVSHSYFEGPHERLSRADVRQEARVFWGERVAAWLAEL